MKYIYFLLAMLHISTIKSNNKPNSTAWGETEEKIKVEFPNISLLIKMINQEIEI